MNFRIFVTRRTILMIPVFIGLSMLIFVISRVMPGDPVRLALGPEATHDQVVAMQHKLGTDQPLYVQYGRYMTGLLRGDWGLSLQTQRNVATDIATYLPATLELALAAMFIALVVGIPLGVVSAVRKDRWQDQATRVVALGGVALPRFWLAILIQLVIAFHFKWLPAIGRATTPPAHVTGFYLVDSLLTGNGTAFWDSFRHLVLPATTLSLASVAQIMRLTRASMIEQTRKDYMTAARSYGLPDGVVVYKYMLKNSLTSVLTIAGLTFGSLLENAFLVETVFAWPGMANYGVQAVINKDFNAVVGVTLVIGIVYIFSNMLVDLLYGWLDPRVRLGGEQS